MERVNFYRSARAFYKFSIVFGSILTFIGILLLATAIKNGFRTTFPSGDWNSIFSIVQGCLFILMGYFSSRNNKYYIEWTDDEFRVLMPGSRNEEIIKRSEIISVTTRLFEIEIRLPDGPRIINLENMDFEDIRKLKGVFEESIIK